MIVKTTPVLFLLYSVYFHFTLESDRLRFFSFLNKDDYPWNSAMKECNEKNESLVTLYDEEDGKFTDKLCSTKTESGEFWLGLHRSGQSVSTWSDGVPLTFNRSDINVTKGEQICAAIVNNTWKGFNCSERKPFMCYKDNNYFLIENEAKNWCQALHYCRKHHWDLVSIRDEEQNQRVIKRGKGTTFWIGLMYDEWKWLDNSCSTYREWDDIEREYNCTTQFQSPKLHNQGCENGYLALCSKGSVRIKVIQKNLTWENAFDYCKANHTRLLQIEDEKDQKAVEQWLNYTGVNGKFWIGLKQSCVFGFWIWNDKTVSYSNWMNNKMPAMPLSNHCGVISKTDNYSWSDENCLLQLPFICEEEIVYMKN